MSNAIALSGLLDDADVAIDIIALELSALDHDGTSIELHLELVDQMAARVLELSHQVETPAHKAAVLATVIAEENGFTGDRQSYDAPVNADMIRVFDRRQGLPVSLAIIYVAVARRLGWTAHVLDLPGHVLVSIGDDEPVVIDVFNDGAVVGIEMWHTKPIDGHRGILTARALRMSNRDVLIRLLQNQASRAEQARDYERAVIIYERMTIVAPDHPHGWGALARLQLMFGANEPARSSLISLLEITRDPDDRARIAQALAGLAHEQ